MKTDFKDLLEKGQLKHEPGIGKEQVELLMIRAEKDLDSASKLISFDEAGAMDFVYKAFFHTANALLRLHGYRPGPVRQHQGVLIAVERMLGKEYKQLLLKFNRLRKRRNRFEYLGIFEMGTQELKGYLEAAKQFVTAIKREINQMHSDKSS